MIIPMQAYSTTESIFMIIPSLLPELTLYGVGVAQ
jgi:hypothetical protein